MPDASGPVRSLPRRSAGRAGAGLGELALQVGLRAALRTLDSRRRQPRPARQSPPVRRPAEAAPAGMSHVAAARKINRAAGMLALSVLADSGVEHYRGSFHNPAMYAPLLSSVGSLAVSAHGSGDPRSAAHPVRDGFYGLALAVGLAGTGFHLYNVAKRPGGFSWHNLFYSAPIGAPFALTLAGLLGLAAERVRDNPSADRPAVLGVPAGRAMAAVTAVGMAGTIAEVGLLHFRGAYQNPAMFLPVTIPPITVALLVEAALGARRSRPLTRWWLRLTAWMGMAGTAFHAIGIARAMGGWRNWSQNVVDGPPLPAPPSFTALSIAGLGALDLLETSTDHEGPDA